MSSIDPLGVLPSRLEAWRGVVDGLDEPSRSELGVAVVQAWIAGTLEPRVRDAYPSERKMRAALDAAMQAFGDIEVEVHARAIDEGVARKWCWIRAWTLMDQDEDLFLMDDAFVTPLLDEAAGGCPKREYAIEIVEHHLRDQAHAALRVGWQETRAHVRSYERWLPELRAVGRHEYVERLLAHIAPAKLSRADAEERVRDFWRCYAPAPAQVELETARDGWRARISKSESIVVERKTGAIRVE